MFETLNFTLNWFGLLLQIAGVAGGAYTLTQIKYREGNFDSKSFDSKIFDTGDDITNLPIDPKTKKPIFPIIYNHKMGAFSVGSLIIGLSLQLMALNFLP